MEQTVGNTQSQSANIMLNVKSSSSFLNLQLIIGLIAAIVLGIGTGYFLGNKSSVGLNMSDKAASGSSSDVKVVGSSDTKTFKDSAKGVLKTGGINGEGAYHLERPGGVSQNVYLTSSVVDLLPYVGKEITVWGETQKAQYAGWLMDVGRVESPK